MLRSDFFYELPEELIASEPAQERTASRLLCLNAADGRVEDRVFTELPGKLRQGDLLILNDTRVIPARLYGRKSTGGKVEVLVERITSVHRALAHVRCSKSPRVGSRLTLEGGIELEISGRDGDLYELRAEDTRPLTDVLEEFGHVPLPPYIRRADHEGDRERYQTVYAREPGAVAAPTAGLHFDEPMLGLLSGMGVETAYVTLHVGAGTFQPVRAGHLRDHRMHPEYLRVSEEVCRKIEKARARQGRIVAVGTTVVRSLESAAQSGRLLPFEGDTELFITPGYHFRCVDALLTNFHLPESTLLMLVCAFAGFEPVMAAYRHAIEQRYRFFSYGDAMFIQGPDRLQAG